MQVRWKSLCVYIEDFLVYQLVKNFENWSTFAKVIKKHQVAQFLTHDVDQKVKVKVKVTRSRTIKHKMACNAKAERRRKKIPVINCAILKSKRH